MQIEPVCGCRQGEKRVHEVASQASHLPAFSSHQYQDRLMRGWRGEQGEGREDWGGGNGQVSEEAQNGNKEGAGSDPRGIPAERQQEWWGVAASSALQEMPIKKLHLVLLSFFKHQPD